MKNTFVQFFDRKTFIGLGALLALNIVSWIVQHTAWSVIPMIVIAVGIVIVTSRSLVWGVALAMSEILIGGHGHLIDMTIGDVIIGLRMIVFVAVMIGTMYHVIIKKQRPQWIPERDVPLLLLLVAVFLGSLIGIMNNPLFAAFDDANAYVTLGYWLPIAMISWTHAAKRIMVWMLALSAMWIALYSLILIYAFDHLSPSGIWTLYQFVRDARLFEVTVLSGPAIIVDTLGDRPWFFRVFGPAQSSVMVFTLLISSFLCFVVRSWKERWLIAGVLVLLFAIDLGGMSRSFWLGLFAGFFALAIAVFHERVNVRELVKIKSVVLLAVIAAVGLVWIAIALPFPERPDLRNSPYVHGKDDDTRELAVSSRWNLLGPMMEKITEAPILGTGFGTTVTFISDDPRVRAINPNGEWTTYRFEWGYQDIWMKMGILGLLAFALIFISILRATRRALQEKHDDRWLLVGMACGVMAIFAAHAFSPYLNHPIGIGFLLMTLPFFPWRSSTLPHVATVIDAMPKVSLPQPVQNPISVRE